MNNKGFTLIELLAVIAILAILVVLAVPSVLKLFNQGKDTLFYTEARDIYKRAKDQYVSAHLTDINASNDITYTDENALLEMDIAKDLDFTITVTMDEDANVIVSNYSISKTGTSYTFNKTGNVLIDDIKKED